MLNIVRAKSVAMPEPLKPWPRGLEVKNPKFYSLEDELWHYLRFDCNPFNHSGFKISTEAISSFVQQVFNREDVSSEVRSFMRYLQRVERFVFEGPSRSRYVTVVDIEELESTLGWKEIANGIINHMLDETIRQGSRMSTNKSNILEYLDKNEIPYNDNSFNRAIDNLNSESRIANPGLPLPIAIQSMIQEDDSITWNIGGFIGTGEKKSSGLRLPVRTWDRIQRLRDTLNKEGVMMLTKSSPVGFGSHLEIFDDYTDNDIIKLALTKLLTMSEITTSEVVEAAVEVLYSGIQGHEHQEQEEADEGEHGIVAEQKITPDPNAGSFSDRIESLTPIQEDSGSNDVRHGMVNENRLNNTRKKKSRITRIPELDPEKEKAFANMSPPVHPERIAAVVRNMKHSRKHSGDDGDSDEEE